MTAERYSYSYIIESTFTPAINRHYFKLRVVPKENERQHIISQQLVIDPCTDLLRSTDGFGNNIQYGSCETMHGQLSIESSGVVELLRNTKTDNAPSHKWRCASKLVEPDADIRQWAMHLAGTHPAVTPDTIHQQALCLMYGVHDRIEYCRFATNNETSASQVFRNRQGVCQDYAHLMIAACRSLGYCARYVNGLVEGEGETHAWVEVHDGQNWRAYDPTHASIVEHGYIELAHGRDVSDCPSNRGHFYSWAEEQMTVRRQVIKLQAM